MPWYNPSDPKQRNLGILGVVLLLAPPLAYNQFYHTGATAEVQTLTDSLATLEQQNVRARILAARGGGQIEETMAEYERQVAQLEELIPEGEEVASLIQQMAMRARQVGVRQNDISPPSVEGVGMYERRAYQVSFIGEYHAVGRLLADIASLPRIVRPVELEVEAFPNPAQFPQYDAPVIANFRIETYVLPPNAGGAPAPESEGSSS